MVQPDDGRTPCRGRGPPGRRALNFTGDDGMIAQATLQTQPRFRERIPAVPETRAPHVNVGEGERWTSFLGGTALTLYGVSRGGLGGLALAAVGGSLVYRGVSGHCDVYQALGVSPAERHGP